MKPGVIVIGDCMLDKYTFGEIERLNPEEHGAPLIRATGEEYRLGGAANVAANISNIGIDTHLIGVFGNDYDGELAKSLVAEKNITLYSILHTNPTIVKERIMYEGRQLVRVDKEKYNALSDAQVDEIIAYVSENLPKIIVFSDYGKGIANTTLLHRLKEICSTHNSIIIADVKPQNMDLFHGIHLVKPNFKEFCLMIGREIDKDNIVEIEKYGKQLCKDLNTNLVITRGSSGASLITLDLDIFHLPAKKCNVVDVTGAGDSFLAGITLGKYKGMSLQDAVILGNQASGAVVGKLGTSLVEKEDIAA